MTTNRRAVQYFEIDIPRCALVYSVLPCMAALGVTGVIKCFNSLGTCQDIVNFDEEFLTIRLSVPNSYLPQGVESIPCLKSVGYTPGMISLGEDLGTRSMVTVVATDFPFNDVGHDKYLDERPYIPEDQGTFWGKFRARNPYVEGRPARLITGFEDQTLEEMETRHFLMESISGPSPNSNTVTIVAKDVLSQLDFDKSQAPLLNNGSILNDIAAGAGSLTLTPSGIGDAEYETSGYLALGGKEIVGFTRSGDTVTLTGRGQLNTDAIAHSSGDRVQTVLAYEGEDPADILNDLIVNYGGLDQSYINLAEWQEETGTFLQRVYTAYIAEPTSLKALVGELIQQAALTIWSDDIEQQLRLRVLRPVSTSSFQFNEENVKGSFAISDQPNKRVSQVWTYFAQRNPLRPLTDLDNYRSSELTVENVSETFHDQSRIKKIYSRWIPFGGRSVAERMNLLLLGRYSTPPRKVKFEVMRDTVSVVSGNGYRLRSRAVQDPTGAKVTLPFQVTRLLPGMSIIGAEGEEILFTGIDPEDLTARVIIIDAPDFNLNLLTIHNTLFPLLTDADVGYVTIKCFINAGVLIGSANTSTNAFIVGESAASFPTGLDIELHVLGRIQGVGGMGGHGAGATGGNPNGLQGGPALYTRFPFTLFVPSGGQIWGGGGGGGGGATRTWTGGTLGGCGGSGGQGNVPGSGQNGGVNSGGAPPGQAAGGASGTTEAGGPPVQAGANLSGGFGGSAGSFGQSGQNLGHNNQGAGAPPGASIDGISLITVADGSGSILGPTIN